jgi:hypothetical protein
MHLDNDFVVDCKKTMQNIELPLKSSPTINKLRPNMQINWSKLKLLSTVGRVKIFIRLKLKNKLLFSKN